MSYYNDAVTQWSNTDPTLCACQGNGFIPMNNDEDAPCPFHYKGSESWKLKLGRLKAELSEANRDKKWATLEIGLAQFDIEETELIITRLEARGE